MCCISMPPARRCPASRTLDATLGHLQLEAEIGGYEAAAKADDDARWLLSRRSPG